MIVDFRARPNTPEYMKDYSGLGKAAMWRRFGVAEPAAVPVEEFGAQLEHHGIDLAVFTGRQVVRDGVVQFGVSNDYVAACVRATDRLIGFAGVDPTTGPAAAEEVRRAVGGFGLSGLSLDPAIASVYPDDRLFYPLYGVAAELGIPVVLTLGPYAGRWGDPWHVDRVALDFPSLTIVCSHGCWPQVTELLALAYRNEHVYLEASIYEFLPGATPFIEAAGDMLQDQVVYASAFPFNPLSTLKRFRESFGFSPAVLAKLTGGNAARILGLAHA